MSASSPTSCRISQVLVAVAMASATIAAPLRAVAQPAAGPAARPAPVDKTAQAAALFREGKTLMDAGKLAEACAAFERSQAVEARVTTVVNHANCREKNGQLATAARLFAETAEQLRIATEEDSVALRKLATDRVAALQPRLSRLTLRIAPGQPPGFELHRGGVPAPSAQWNQPWPVDGGTYELFATAPGHQSFTATVTLRNEGDAQTFDIPVLSVETATPAAPVPATDPLLVTGTTSSSGKSLALPIGLGIGGVVLGSVAVGVYISARGINDDAQADLDNDLWEQAEDRRKLSIGIAVAGGACVGAAVLFYVLDRGNEKNPTVARRSLSPLLGNGSEGSVTGMQLSGSW